MNTRLILELLKSVGRTTDVLLDIFLGGYTKSYKKMRRKVLYPTLPDFSKKNDKFLLKKKKHNFYSLVYQLRKQGLIEKKRKGNKSYWQITTWGREKLKKIKFSPILPKHFYKFGKHF